jgi:hypothetical protein
MKNTLMKIAMGTLLAATLGIGGCNSPTARPEESLAKYILAQDPNTLIKESGTNSTIYHTPGLKFKEGWALEGKGKFIEIHSDGDLSVCDWNSEEIRDWANGKINPYQLEGSSFGYQNRDGKETVTLYGNHSLTVYSIDGNDVTRTVYDIKGLKSGINIEDLPKLSTKKMNASEIGSYLETVKKLKSKYQ